MELIGLFGALLVLAWGFGVVFGINATARNTLRVAIAAERTAAWAEWSAKKRWGNDAGG